MFNSDDYRISYMFFKFNNRETVLGNAFEHKKTNKLYIMNPIQMKMVEDGDDFKVVFVKWLPLGDDNLLYPLNPNHITSSGMLSHKVKKIYEEAISADLNEHMRNIEIEEIKNIVN